jgi:hypothetical protein
VSDAEKEALLKVFASVVRPLTRLALENNISASEVSSVVRRCFTQAIERRLELNGESTTDARVAIAAGLTRSEVVKARDADRKEAERSSEFVSLDQITAVLSVWHTHPEFSGAYGLALDLDRRFAPGSSRKSFPELVDLAWPGLSTEALIDALEKSGSIEIIGGHTVRALTRAYVPQGEDVTRIERMGRFLEAFTGNFVHNLTRPETEPAYFERAVTSDFPLAELERNDFLGMASERSQGLLSELDTFLSKLPAASPASGAKRYGVGIYFFEEQPGRVFSVAAAQVPKKAAATARTSTTPIEIDLLAPPPSLKKN